MLVRAPNIHQLWSFYKVVAAQSSRLPLKCTQGLTNKWDQTLDVASFREGGQE